MEKENVKVSYGKTWNKDGTVFSKRLSISRNIADCLFDILQAEGEKEKDWCRALLLKTPIERTRKIAFLNLTQSRFIIEKLIECDDISINKKRARINCNAYLLINE